MTELSTSQNDFISYSSMVGLALGVACLFQQLYIINGDFLIAICFAMSAIAAIVAFSFLLFKKKEVGVMMIVASSLLFLRQTVIAFMALKMGVVMFSLLQIFLFVYCIVITVLVLVNGYPKLFAAMAAEKKADDEYWKNV